LAGFSNPLLHSKSLKHSLLGIHFRIILAEPSVYNASDFISLLSLLDERDFPLHD
jgi:hypothetical protein